MLFRRNKTLPRNPCFSGDVFSPPGSKDWKLQPSWKRKGEGLRMGHQHPEVVTGRRVVLSQGVSSSFLLGEERCWWFLPPWAFGVYFLIFLNTAYTLTFVIGSQPFTFCSKTGFTWTTAGWAPVVTCELQLWFLSEPLHLWYRPVHTLSSILHFF